MATYRAPGVYIEEVPGARTISGVSTDIAAFVGITERGKQNVPTLITSWNEYRDLFGSFVWNRYVPMAVYNYFAEGGAQCYIVSTGMDAAFVAGTVDVAEYVGTGTGSIKFRASSPGAWSQTIRIGIVAEPPEPDQPVSFSVQVIQPQLEDDAFGPDADMSLSLVMIDRYIIANKAPPTKLPDLINGAVLEEFSGFTSNDLVGGVVNPSGLMQRINGTSLFLRVETVDFAEKNTKLPKTAVLHMENGASGSLVWLDGLNTLDPILDFSTIALPDCVDQSSYTVTQPKGTSYEEVWDWNDINVKDAAASKNATLDMLGKCEEWQRVFSVDDPPYGYDVSGVRSYKTGTAANVGQPLNSTYGALYYPWLKVSDPYTGNLLWVPPSGQTLGRYSATDRTIGVWKAPAGVESGKLLTARGIELDVTTSQQELLNPDGIDVIRPILSYGICVYGARTISLNSEWRYVPVRRLAIFIEQSLYFAMQWVVFEPNSPGLWGTVTRDVTNFMTGLWRDGALFGTSAAEAFSVVCDASNNPPATRDEGYLYIDVGFAPVKPAEFVVIRLSQLTLSA